MDNSYKKRLRRIKPQAQEIFVLLLQGYGLFNRNDPALGVGQLAPLDAGQGVVQFLGQLADLAAADVGNLALPVQFLDRGNDRGRAGAKDLLQLALVGSVRCV